MGRGLSGRSDQYLPSIRSIQLRGSPYQACKSAGQTHIGPGLQQVLWRETGQRTALGRLVLVVGIASANDPSRHKFAAELDIHTSALGAEAGKTALGVIRIPNGRKRYEFWIVALLDAVDRQRSIERTIAPFAFDARLYVHAPQGLQ
jgi:hypothetical protein